MTANFSIRAILVYLALASFTPAAVFAQPMPPKKEADLVAAGNKPLTGSEITALLLGNTAYITFLSPAGNFAAGSLYYVYYRDAKTRVLAPSRPGAFKKHEANWWIEGDKVCYEVTVTSEKNDCLSVYRISSGVFPCNANGVCRLLYRIVPGNPEKL